jgi:hypothetical protein
MGLQVRWMERERSRAFGNEPASKPQRARGRGEAQGRAEMRTGGGDVRLGATGSPAPGCGRFGIETGDGVGLSVTCGIRSRATLTGHAHAGH